MQMASSLAKDTKVALTSLLARKTTTKLVARAMPAARTRKLKPLKRRLAAKTRNNSLSLMMGGTLLPSV
jgi:hypothetical protein